MSDIAALAALGLTAVIQLGIGAYVYGKLTQKVSGHADGLRRTFTVLDEHDKRLRDHGERISALEGGKR